MLQDCLSSVYSLIYLFIVCLFIYCVFIYLFLLYIFSFLNVFFIGDSIMTSPISPFPPLSPFPSPQVCTTFRSSILITTTIQLGPHSFPYNFTNSSNSNLHKLLSALPCLHCSCCYSYLYGLICRISAPGEKEQSLCLKQCLADGRYNIHLRRSGDRDTFVLFLCHT